MSESVTTIAERQEADSKTIFGFWVYLMTDCVLFATLFATFAVLRNNTFGGPAGKDIFEMPYVLAETMLLLTSSFTCGLAMLAAHRKDKTQVFVWFIVTFMLGLAFLGLEIAEFRTLIHEGYSWRRSGFLSAFFTLVGTHGAHITVGLLWIVAMLAQVYQRGLGHATVKRLTMLSLFWHFLDIVWIFIFTIVYLMGVIG
jgi:cytochrome o ubiquinol oxidase subunit 3